MKLISACLLGIKCAWDGEDKYRSDKAIEFLDSAALIPVCPERLGGLKTPRIPQEIQGGSGEDVLDGRCRVLNRNGEDVTREFITGAKETLKIARQFHVDEFIGKSKSPSCGCGQIYDGTFSQKLVVGDGVTTALLKRNGIRVITEESLDSTSDNPPKDLCNYSPQIMPQRSSRPLKLQLKTPPLGYDVASRKAHKV